VIRGKNKPWHLNSAYLPVHRNYIRATEFEYKTGQKKSIHNQSFSQAKKGLIHTSYEGGGGGASVG
jgi:hypothetical protein